MRERLLFSKKPRFPLKIIILVLITVIILLVAYQLVSRAKWDGISRFTIVFQSISNSESGENELVIFSIEPRQHRAVYIVVPVELQLNVPYGYKINRTIDDHGKVHREVVVEEDQTKNVRWIFDEYIKGKGVLDIAFQLNEKKVKPPRSLLWRRQSVKYILQNQTYTGKVLWGWRHADYKKNKQRK